MDGTRLILQLPDGEPVVLPTTTGWLSFGRSTGPLQVRCDGEVDPGMSRTIAQVGFDKGWWIHNPAEVDPWVQRRQPVDVADERGAKTTVEPGGSCQLPPHGTIRFSTTRANYALRFHVEGASIPSPPEDELDPTQTIRPRLYPREVDYLVTLARPELAGSSTTDTRPTFDWVAEVWHVSRRAVEESTRKARSRMEAAGHVDLGGRTGSADLTDRFVRWLVEMSLLREEDWQWAFGDGLPPRPASEGPRFRTSAGPRSAGHR
jgi:hypothetical protein